MVEFSQFFTFYYLAEYSAGWRKLSAEIFGRFCRKFGPNIRFRSYTKVNKGLISLIVEFI